MEDLKTFIENFSRSHPPKVKNQKIRAEARERGERFFTSTRICPHGHTPSIRYVSTGACIDCQKARSGKYPTKTRADHKAYMRHWYQNNREDQIEYMKRYYRDVTKPADKARALERTNKKLHQTTT